MSIPLSEFHRCELCKCVEESLVSFLAMTYFTSEGAAVSELEVVFPLKEFKAMLQFAENKELRCEEVNLYLNEPGKPVLISTKSKFFASPKRVNGCYHCSCVCADSQTSVPFYADMILATVNLNTQTAGDVNSKKRPRDEISQASNGNS